MTINANSNRFKALVWLTLFAALLFALSVVIISGCTETLEGNVNENLAPVVYFVNIPPDSTKFSYNPEIYWFGSDADGQIDYYRYHIATVDEIGSSSYEDALNYAAGLPSEAWTYTDVDPQASDPQTAHVITLEADVEDPVRTYVEQFVFLQAFDDDGAGSAIVCKCLNRNDHPPDTRIINTIKNDTPYVNAPGPGGIVTGIKLSWDGTDVRDYDEQGLVAPPFEYEWRLFGPYTAGDSSEIFDAISGLVRVVWVTDDAEIYYCGQSAEFCDSHLVEDESIYWEVECTTVVFECGDDTTGTNTILGFRRDFLLDISDTSSSFFGDDWLVDRSWDGIDTWIYDMADTIYDVYHMIDPVDRGDSTITRSFIFWIRSRDDASVPDLTPAFAVFPVIDPMYERDILVLDFTNTFDPGYGQINMDSTVSMRKAIFKRFIDGWNDTRAPSEQIDFDTTGLQRDYLVGVDYNVNPLPLPKLLQYKLLILYSDHVRMSFFMSGTSVKHNRVFTAIDAGINAWVTQRGLIYGSLMPQPTNPATIPSTISHYFGVEGIFYSSWAAFLQGSNSFMPEEIRMEDFIGAYTMDESQWPNIDVDTNLLHRRLTWWEDVNPIVKDCPWVADTAALPEVNWCKRRYGTEVMYLYKSMYGPNHFLGYPYTIDGTPVAHRLQTNLFRTVWFQFSPSCIKEDQMQLLTNSVLDWLYDPTIGQETVNERRYPDAAVKISIDEARELLDGREPIVE
ncbi:MAG: hypothetical protein JSV52_10375 [Candidatus Zixiibacteriota bacterium]|nr:MAG: hypothetical protein JSV52_10375 [candidate division Zixibacteria bacterium]